MIERMLGTDALLWHMERTDVPIHTLKTVVLDPTRTGRQLTLDDLRAAITAQLGLLPRLTQRVQTAPRFPGRPFWVPAPDFRLDDHLDERRVPAPGGRNELDAIHSELAARHLDPARPLWGVTLVHGLAEGRQAVVTRIHHAVTDGLGALNSFMLLTTDNPEASVPQASWRAGAPPKRRELQRRVLRDAPSLIASLGPLAVDGVRNFVKARRFRREHPDLPPFLGTHRNFTNRSAGGERVCASHDLDFGDLRAVAKTAGVTINGVYHALIAAALRDELIARAEDLTRPTVASFGIASDTSDTARVHGNYITPTVVSMFSNIDDPVERLVRTSRSCREGVELRNLTGLDMTARWADFTCRLAPFFARHAGHRSPRIVNHITTANVAGPHTRRHTPGAEVVDWISFAIVVSPSNINITAYSYAGRMSVGLVTTPNVLSDPRKFLLRMEHEIAVLRDALAARSLVGEHSGTS